MIKKSIYIFTILMFSCNTNSIDCVNLSEKDNLVYLEDKLYSGECFSKNGNVTIEIRNYKKGKRHGKWRGYYTTGEIQYEGYCKDNELHGEFISYYENGQKKAEGNFDKGFQIGKWVRYDQNGEIKETKNYKTNINE